MKTIRLVMVGFGNVGKAFVELIDDKQQELADKYGIHLLVTGVASGKHGCAANPDGIDTNPVADYCQCAGRLFGTQYNSRCPGLSDIDQCLSRRCSIGKHTGKS